MANAIVEIRVSYGSVENVEEYNAAFIPLLSANLGSSALPTQYPLKISSQETQYSYERYFRLYVADMGDAISIRNLRLYCDDPNFITGATLKYGTTQNYSAPSDLASSIATTAIPSSIPSTANIGIDGDIANELTSPGYSDYVVLQLEIPPATVNAGGSTGLHIIYDEVH